MSQLSLFESHETVFVDDATGRVPYTPRLVSAPLAEAWFAELRETVGWKAERRQMYDREVDVPRLTAHFRFVLDDPAPSDVPGPIPLAAREVAAKTGVRFNSVGLN